MLQHGSSVFEADAFMPCEFFGRAEAKLGVHDNVWVQHLRVQNFGPTGSQAYCVVVSGVGMNSLALGIRA